jgi:hypothetical protein
MAEAGREEDACCSRTEFLRNCAMLHIDIDIDIDIGRAPHCTPDSISDIQRPGDFASPGRFASRNAAGSIEGQRVLLR